MAVDKNQLVALAREIVQADMPSHAERIAKATAQCGLKDVTSKEDLTEFLVQRVEQWAAACEHAVNSVDFRRCQSEAQLALFLYKTVADN